MITTSSLSDFPEWQSLEKQLILLTYRGSIAHNMFVPSTEPNSIDDIDLMGIVIPDKNYYFGLDNFGSKDTKEIKHRELDMVFYEIRKLVRLLMKGNPNVISMLFLQPEHYLIKSKAGELLIKNRDLFLTQELYHSFLGYAKAQLYKTDHSAFKGYMGEKRKQLVEKHGYDTKNAAHLIRLMTMCNEFLQTKTLQVYRTTDRDFLLSIKNGAFSLDEIKNMSDKLFLEGHELFTKHKDEIPKEMSRARANQLLLEIFEEIKL